MAEISSQTPKKRQFLFNPLKRPMPYVGLILALLIVIFQGTIRQYTANLVGDWLVSNLKEATEGNYTLDYDFVRFDIFTKELRIQNLNLSLDTTVIDKEAYLDTYTNLIDLSTPVVVLKLESLWDLIFNDKLLIAYIGMQEPRVKLIRSENLTEKENLENQQVATEKLRSYLKEIEVDSIRILNGAIQVDLQNAQKQDLVDFKIRNFSTLLRGFKLDEINPNKLFQGIYAEVLELEVLDQELILPRLHHQIKFERLWISTIDSIIQFDTLKIEPLASADSTFKGQLILNELSLKGIDFKKAYNENKIDIKRLLLDEPKISLAKKRSKLPVNNDFKKNNLPFKDIFIHQILLNNGKVNLALEKKVSSEHINIKLDNYRIDTAGMSMDDFTKNIKEFSFTAANSIIELPDSIHELKIGHLQIESIDSLALLNNIRLNPIVSRRTYKLYKERGVRQVNYSTIKQIYLGGINFDQLINHQQLLADSILILAPTANITEYAYIERSKKDSNIKSFLISNFHISNGRLNYNKRQNRQNHRTQLHGISVSINNLYPDLNKPVAFDNMDIFISAGFTEIKKLGHTIRFNKLESKNLTDFDIAELYFSPDSASIKGEKIDINSTGLRIRGFDQELLANTGSLKINELTLETISLNADLKNKREPGTNSNQLNNIIINKFYFNKGGFNIKDGSNEIRFENVSTLVDSLHYDTNDTVRVTPVDFTDLLVNHGKFSIRSLSNNALFSGRQGSFSDADSLISFKNITFKSNGQIQGSLKEIYIKGLDKHALLGQNGIRFNYLYLDKPTIEISALANKQRKFTINNDSLKNKILAQFSFIEFDSIINSNANIKVSSGNRLTELHNFNTIIKGYKLDSTSAANDVFIPDELNLSIANITTKSNTDTINVQRITLDMVNNTLFTGNIDIKVYQNQTIIKASIPGLIAKGFSTTKLLNNDFSLDTIRFSQASIMLITQDSLDTTIDTKQNNENISLALTSLFKKSSKLMFDTLLKTKNEQLQLDKIELDSSKNINFKKILSKIKLKAKEDYNTPETIVHEDSLIKVTVAKKAFSTNGIIKYVGLHNSSFVWQKNDVQHSFLSGLKFNIDVNSIILDSLHDFNIYNHIHDIAIKIKDYKVNLPDSLNIFSIDELSLSTQKESIEAQNISLTPRVNKYEYANKVGHQAGWHHLHDLDLRIEGLNIFELLSNKAVHIKKITTSNGTLDIFKDKELPIPVNQRRPMIQDAIKNIKLPVLIDSMQVDNFQVNFSSRLSSATPEGSLNFHELNALATNIVNTDSAISINPYFLVMASTKIMNKGLLKANFNFDLSDNDNRFIYDAHLDQMEAKEFNSLLEALAYVSVESGTIKELKFEAEGDNAYSTGNMRFVYNNLKVSTINKKNLKTKGMGKVMKTFFANAFVVKKNNPAFKFFPREGAMYYERDPQKMVIDYVTRAALTGVISSIGGRNARKDIKKIQNESKKQKDAERKALKKAGKNISGSG